MFYLQEKTAASPIVARSQTDARECEAPRMYDLRQGFSEIQQPPDSHDRPHSGLAVRVRSLSGKVQEIVGAEDAQANAHGREKIRVRHMQASFPPERRAQASYIGSLWCVSFL